jgi:hypothetical protein
MSLAQSQQVLLSYLRTQYESLITKRRLRLFEGSSGVYPLRWILQLSTIMGAALPAPLEARPGRSGSRTSRGGRSTPEADGGPDLCADERRVLTGPATAQWT